MQEYCVGNILPPSNEMDLNFWTTASDSESMTAFQLLWPGFSIPLPYLVNVPRSPYPAQGGDLHAAGVQLPLTVPRLATVIENGKSYEEGRLFILDRSVFDLVDAHPYLALTDPKLLGWYLNLSPEDRKIIQDEGGFHHFLHRHPALELSSHHVYVKYNIRSISPAQPSMSSNNHISRKSGAKTCRCDIPHAHRDLEMPPNNVRETLTLPGPSNSRGGSLKYQTVEICHALHLQDNFKTASNSPITQEPNRHKAYKARDSPLSELNKERPSWQMDSSSSSTAAVCKDQAAFSVETGRGQGTSLTYADVAPLQSEWPTSKRDSPYVDTIDDDHRHTPHSIMEDDKSILVCRPSEDVSMSNLGRVCTNAETLAASSETLKPDQSVIKKKNTAEEHTATVLRITTCDIMVDTELALCLSASTQTEDPSTSDKNFVTEVQMADLEYHTEEFIKLMKATVELRKRKEKMKSSGCKLIKECDCIQCAQQAELCLLALQYSLCRQHWRLFDTSAEGGQLTPMSKNPSGEFSSVLQNLESDYNQMRDKILGVVPLEQLKPLCVDSEKITTGASCSHSQIIADVLGNVPAWCPKEPQKNYISDEQNGSLYNQGRNGCQHREMREQYEKDSKGRAVSLLLQDRDAIQNANMQEEKQTTAACKELNVSETWYDAEEDLEHAGHHLDASDAGQDPPAIAKDTIHDSASDEAKSSVLCVFNLPSNVTENDLILWFEKYHASEVSISALKNDLRVAIVIVSGPKSAEAAVRELNGCSMQGHTLHVEHINRAFAVCQSHSISEPESSQEATNPQTSKADSASSGRKLIIQPPLSSSMNNRKVICISPTAKGTCVPQHYGTMGSFDTLMAELTKRHPDAGRQRIVDALMELKTKHQGVLSSLPLTTIREMTSELLTRPASAIQL